MWIKNKQFFHIYNINKELRHAAAVNACVRLLRIVTAPIIGHWLAMTTFFDGAKLPDKYKFECFPSAGAPDV